jgi:pilus assembly protein CpaB
MHLRNLLFAVGLVALVAGATLAVLWIAQGGTSDNRSATAPVPPVSVLVAAETIRQGTLLHATDMAWKEMPADRAPPAAIRKQPDAQRAFIGAVTRRDFAAGEPIVPGGLIKAGERGFLAAVLAPGMRAVSIAVDASTSAAGLIQPGDRVDVLLAQSLGQGIPGSNAVSETVLKDVRVIAVDQWFSGAQTAFAGTKAPFGTAQARIPKTITLEVDDGDAKRLLVAAQLGKVTLALRSLQRQNPISARGADTGGPVWASDVSSGPRGDMRKAPGPPGRTGRKPVQIMRGSKTEVQ